MSYIINHLKLVLKIEEYIERYYLLHVRLK